MEERTISSIYNSDIKESCAATLLLIFAAIDSLSKITCDSEEYELFKANRGNRDRFKSFLTEVMGNQYSIFKDHIYDLRNDIVHTGINTKVILFKDIYYRNHFKLINGYLWINTNIFLNDLKAAIEKIKKDIEVKGKYYQNAEDRIRDFNLIDVNNQPWPSPGPEDEPFLK